MQTGQPHETLLPGAGSLLDLDTGGGESTVTAHRFLVQARA
jgi:hypothetical protein